MSGKQVLAPVVQRVDNAIHRINHYPVDSLVCFPNTYSPDGDLSGGYRYPLFEQLGPGANIIHFVFDKGQGILDIKCIALEKIVDSKLLNCF